MVANAGVQRVTGQLIISRRLASDAERSRTTALSNESLLACSHNNTAPHLRISFDVSLSSLRMRDLQTESCSSAARHRLRDLPGMACARPKCPSLRLSRKSACPLSAAADSKQEQRSVLARRGRLCMQSQRRGTPQALRERRTWQSSWGGCSRPLTLLLVCNRRSCSLSHSLLHPSFPPSPCARRVNWHALSARRVGGS